MGKWEEVELGEIAKCQSGGTPRRSNKTFWEKGSIPWLKSGELNDNTCINEHSESITDEALRKSSAKLFSKGTLLIAMYGATAGKLGILGIDSSTNQAVCSIQNIENKFKTKFIYNFLLSKREEIIRDSFGGAQPNISKGYLENLKIPLPPLPEQERIVAKLDGLFEKIDRAITLVEENIAHTQALMGSVLDEEFGRLECEKKKLSEVSTKIQYGYTGKTVEHGDYHYLRITDIQNDRVNFDKVPRSDIPADKVEKYVLNKGDILFARTGATAGKSYLFDQNEKSVFASYLIRVVCDNEILNPLFLKWYFQSDSYWDQIFGNIVGAAQPNFNGKKLGQLILPVPKKKTQEQLIIKFEEFSSKHRKMIEQQTQQLSWLKSLKSSLLDKAFKGEL